MMRQGSRFEIGQGSSVETGQQMEQLQNYYSIECSQ